MKITGILVTGVGGGVGQSIIKCLHGSPYKIIGVDSMWDATGLYAVTKGYLGENAESEGFIDRLLEIAVKESANVIFPGLDVELLLLARNKLRFEENGIKVVVSSEEVVGISNDKYQTAEFLKHNGFLYPRTRLDTAEDIPFPVIVKPRFGGRRSIGVVNCNNQDELSLAIKNKSNFVIQEFIEGDEFTCGALSLEGKCYGVIPMRRELRNGDTYKAYSEKNARIIEYANTVIERLKPFGPCNIQLRVRNGECYIFEFNSRCSGTTAARAIAGFNEPLWVCKVLENKRPEKMDFCEMAILRYWKEIGVDMENINTIRKTGDAINLQPSIL